MTLDENDMSLLAVSLHLPGLNPPRGFLRLSPVFTWPMGNRKPRWMPPAGSPSIMTGLSISNNEKKVPFHPLFNFPSVKKAFCLHYVQFQPSSHTLGFGWLEDFNYSDYTAWGYQCFLPGHPAETRKGQPRWRSNRVGESCWEGPCRFLGKGRRRCWFSAGPWSPTAITRSMLVILSSL